MSAADPLAGHGFWLASRAAGVVALVLLSISVLIGLALAGGVAGPPAVRRRLRFSHEHIAVSALVATAVHGALLLGDPWLRPGLAGVLVPFALRYRPLFTGLGVVAGELAVALGLSFYARRRIGARRWRRLHRLTPAVYALAVVHVLGAGTDAHSRWLAAIVLAPAVVATTLLAVRLAPKAVRA